MANGLEDKIRTRGSLLDAFLGPYAERIRAGEFRTEFYAGGVILFALVIYGWTRAEKVDSKFQSFEADRPKNPAAAGAQAAISHKPGEDPLAKAKMKIHRPLQLEGIRIDGRAHEILGVAPNASAAEINRAYRDLMKRYHPDRVGRPGSREWNDAQKIAEALNRAKEELLKRGQ